MLKRFTVKEWSQIVIIICLLYLMVSTAIGTYERNQTMNKLQENLVKLMDVNIKQELVIDELLLKLTKGDIK